MSLLYNIDFNVQIPVYSNYSEYCNTKMKPKDTWKVIFQKNYFVTITTLKCWRLPSEFSTNNL